MIYMSRPMLPEIYSRCDSEILWEDILLGNSAEDLYMDSETWRYCSLVAKQVMYGEIDTYLHVIEDLAPVDDLLLYGSDFEFGTDQSDAIETEFIVYPDELLKDGKWDSLLGEYVSAVALRVARDLFALLPIQKIAVHVVCESKDVFSGIFDRTLLRETDYNADITTIMKKVQCNYCKQFDGPEIVRMQI